MGDEKTDHRTDHAASGASGALGTVGDPQDWGGRVVLVVAGLDPSGGAGLLADARQVSHHGLRCAGVATALTEQDSTRCAAMYPTPTAIVAAQLGRLVDDLGKRIAAVKIGMLANAEIVAAVAAALAPLSDVPVVVDPVLRATKGVALFTSDPAAYESLFALATLVTPNLAELAVLTGRATAGTAEEMLVAAQRLRNRGVGAVLAKGGHLPGDPIDILVTADGSTRFSGPRVEGPSPHGTGCALSTDIACRLATGSTLIDAVAAGIDRLRQLIAAARPVGRGRLYL